MNQTLIDVKCEHRTTIQSNQINNCNESNHCAISSANLTENIKQDETNVHCDTKTQNEANHSNSNSTNNSTNESNSNINIKTSKSYKDFSGIDTESFIMMTLREYPKDRPLLLNLEKILREFIQDDQQPIYLFQPMNSYERMMVHRVAAYFGLKHNIDQTGQSVIVEKTGDTRIPELTFESVISTNDSTCGAENSNKNPIDGANSYTQESSEESHSAIHNQSKAKQNRSTINRSYRKQNRPFGNDLNSQQQHQQQQQIQVASHHLNANNQATVYGSIVLPPYSQQQMMNGSSMQNYVPVMASQPPTYPHGIPLAPVLLQPTVNTAMSYVYSFPNHRQISYGNPTRQIAPIYQSNMSNTSPIYPHGASLVHVYPSNPINPYFHHIPQTNMKPVEYPTNQFAMMNIQASYDASRGIPLDGASHYRGQYLVQSSSTSSKNGSGSQLVTNRQSRLNNSDKVKHIHQNEIKPNIHNQQPK